MLRIFTSDLRRNLIKIICLTVGLSVGFILIAKVYFEQTYDNFFPDVDRIYRVTESVVENGEYKEYPVTPGAITPGLKRYVPQVECATRYTQIAGTSILIFPDGRDIEVKEIILADTCLFDVLTTRVISGDAHEILDVADYCLIPRSLAEKIGGEVVGQTFYSAGFGDDIKMTIGGVYEDFPLNSTIPNAVYLSMQSAPKFMYDGRENWIGNDRYFGYIRLAKGVHPDDVSESVSKMLVENLPAEAFEISQYALWLRPLSRSYSSQSGVRTMSWMLGILAIVMLMSASLNYLLIVIGQLSGRGKEMAIRKCFGTSFSRLFARVMMESGCFLLISIVLSILLTFCLSDLCQELLGYTPRQLFSTPRIWILEGIVCLVLLVITGAIPAVIYCRTPVSSVFRMKMTSRRIWKLVLLTIQFFSSGLLISLLVLVERQYSMVQNLDMGFEYENIGICSLNDLSADKRSTLLKELRKLPYVENVATYCSRDLSQVARGNNVWVEGQYENQLNIADLEFVNPELIDVMGLKLLSGRGFNNNADTLINEIIVEQRMVEVLQNYFGFNGDDIVGVPLYITGNQRGDNPNPEFTIVGVVGNMRRGGYEREQVDTRAAVMFPSQAIMDYMYIRFNQLSPENLKGAQAVVNEIAGGHQIYITPYRETINIFRNPIRRFGDSVLVVGLVIILIAMIGLVGYVADEVNRRSKEIAIRKVNGTSAGDIVKLFCKDIILLSLPSLILGGVAAMVIGSRWLSQFTDRVPLSPASMIVALIFLQIIITAVVVFNSLRVANGNPVTYLRSE